MARNSLTCMASGRSATSSKKQRAARCGLEISFAIVLGTSKGTFLVAEELSLHQLFRYGATIDRHETALPACHYSHGWRARQVPCRCLTLPVMATGAWERATRV